MKINRTHHKATAQLCAVLGLVLLITVSCAREDSADVNEGVMPDSSGQFSASMLEEVLQQDEQTLSLSEVGRVEEIGSSRRNAITRAVERASPAIVSITVTGVVERRSSVQEEMLRHFFWQNLPREYTFQNIGSGFIISEDGLIVTNQHVVGNGDYDIVIATTDGNTYDGKLLGTDGLSDLALIKIESNEPLPYVEFSDSEEVIVGEWAIAIGNPFGLFEDGRPAVSVGVISAKNRDFRPDPNNPRVYMDMIQTDAAINRGNSGGPLLNSEGRVIGVNTFLYTGGTSAGFVGLGFAIPSNRVEKIVNQLLTAGQVALDYDPGMEFTAMTEELIYRYRLPTMHGLLVTTVNKDGPAFECGVMPGDIITRIGEERVISDMHAWALLREYDEGENMELQIWRDGDYYETDMLLRKRLRGDKGASLEQ
ncbi:MAG: trypsin-like peptidase domain-containing protein [Balneolaceae bacterium]